MTAEPQGCSTRFLCFHRLQSYPRGSQYADSIPQHRGGTRRIAASDGAMSQNATTRGCQRRHEVRHWGGSSTGGGNSQKTGTLKRLIRRAALIFRGFPDHHGNGTDRSAADAPWTVATSGSETGETLNLSWLGNPAGSRTSCQRLRAPVHRVGWSNHIRAVV